MAYAASVSLSNVIERFCNSPDSFVHIHCPDSLPFLERLHEIVKSMVYFDFETDLPSGSGHHLENQIRDSMWRAEDVIESYCFSSSSQSETNFQDLLELIHEIESGMEMMKKLAHDEHKPDSIPIADVLSSIHDLPPRCKNKIVGLEEELNRFKHFILRKITHKRRLGAAVIHGMGGVGKTTLAISFYNDPDVRNHFSVGAWVEISLQYCVRNILLSLLLNTEVFDYGKDRKEIGPTEVSIEDHEALANIVREIFSVERYLVVVDCSCEIDIDSWNYIKSILPDSNNGSRIILVNRLMLHDSKFVFGYSIKSFLGVSQSWELLREQVFGDEPFPHVLEKIGKRIAENCQGLPLAIKTVGYHLAKEEKTVEYWNKVADSGNSIAYDVDGAPMFEQLGLSYKQLYQDLRPIFLYLATFPERNEPDFLEFMNLLIAEGYAEQKHSRAITEWSTGWLLFFEIKNLILVDETDGGTFSLHHALWRLCCKLAQKDEFFHVMNMKNDWEDFPRSLNINNVRRIVISKNVLFGVKDIFKLEHSVLSGIRSLLLTGPNHPYPLTIRWGMYKMLRVLNARSIRFYEFPVEILSLVLLRYLALTLYRAEVPHEISKLRNLQFLIVYSVMKVISYGEAPSCLPMEIWETQQLVHLEVEGADLPVPPPHSDAMLPNLLTLNAASPHSCTKEILGRIPNLNSLLILINLAPKNDVDDTPVCAFDHLVLLKKLEILSCRISNPYFGGQVISIPENIRVSMNNLTRLSLSGCGLPWKSIKQITRLPVLKYLSLQHHAFRGPKWKLSNKGFKKLNFLVLEDLDLVYWTARSGELFPSLVKLRVRRCHKLQQVPFAFKHCHDLDFILVEDSSREVETWALSIRKERSRKGSRVVLVFSPRGASWSTN